MRFEHGAQFAGYTILSRLGRGGMATVYLAREAGLERMVALKVLPEQLVDDEHFAARFEQEAHVIAGLDHPNIIPLYRSGITEDVPWMALRYVNGGDLEPRLRSRSMPVDQVMAILRAVGAALDYAHRKGVIHRDLKPQNILLSDDHSPYLADFGVAKLLEGADKLKTATGNIFGTPAYMAPEQAMGKPLGPYTDVYALAVIAYRAFTGDLPFDADTPHAILMKHVSEPLPQAATALLPRPVAAALERALAKDPQARTQSAGAFVEDLARALEAVSSGRGDAIDNGAGLDAPATVALARSPGPPQPAWPPQTAASVPVPPQPVAPIPANVASAMTTAIPAVRRTPPWLSYGATAVVTALGAWFAFSHWPGAAAPPASPAQPAAAALASSATAAPAVTSSKDASVADATAQTPTHAQATADNRPETVTSTGAAPEPAGPEPASAAATTASGLPPELPGSLCAANERVMFSCQIGRTGKTASLCASGAAVTYRYGTNATLDISLPGGGDMRKVHLVRQWEPDQGLVGIAFVNGAYTYQLESGAGANPEHVTVYKQARSISQMDCTGSPRGDVRGAFADLQSRGMRVVTP